MNTTTRDSEPESRHVHLRVANFEFLRKQPRKHFEWLRIDANDNCNLNCVYCQVPRSDGMISTEMLESFLNENVSGVDNLQFGCGMEPTIDDRLGDLLEMAASSRARPKIRFALQTNGLMLHQHDLEQFKRAGLNLLSVSMDSTDPRVHKELRGGSSVEKIIRNLKSFKLTCPKIPVQILAVITRLNIDGADALARFAIELGVKRLVFREMVYREDGKNIDHNKVRNLVVPPGEFVAMRDRLLDRHDGKLDISFYETEYLKQYGKKSRSQSYPKPSPE